MDSLQMSTLQANFSSQLGQAKSAQGKAKEVAKDFEAFFLYQALELMEPEVDDNSIFSGGSAEKMFRPIMNEYKAEIITENGGIGIADNIYQQLLKYQEVNQ